MVDLGATTAYNLDGGGSSTMVFDGSLVNDPLGKGMAQVLLTMPVRVPVDHA